MDSFVAKVAEQYKAVHGLLRDEVSGLSVDALNWRPAPETTSIAALVVHTLGSEAEVWRVVTSTPGTRDRPAEFLASAETPAELVRQLDHADAYVGEMAPRVTAEDLVSLRPRGDRPPQTGMHWLLTNYGHAREHLAHIQLTKQLYAQAHGG